MVCFWSKQKLCWHNVVWEFFVQPSIKESFHFFYFVVDICVHGWWSGQMVWRAAVEYQMEEWFWKGQCGCVSCWISRAGKDHRYMHQKRWNICKWFMAWHRFLLARLSPSHFVVVDVTTTIIKCSFCCNNGSIHHSVTKFSQLSKVPGEGNHWVQSQQDPKHIPCDQVDQCKRQTDTTGVWLCIASGWNKSRATDQWVGTEEETLSAERKCSWCTKASGRAPRWWKI